LDSVIGSSFDFLRSFTDSNRILSLHLDPGSPSSETLLVARLKGREALSECYAFEVELRTADATIDVSELLGRNTGVALHCNTDDARWFNGVVSRVASRGANGGHARFDVTIQPHFALLGVGRVARTWQDLSVPEILDAELSRWQAAIPELQWRLDLCATYPKRSYTVFHNESALAACERLAAEEGIGYYFEHLPVEGSRVGLQRLVFFDDVVQLQDNVQPTIRFHRADVTEAEAVIDQWEPEQAVAPGEASLQAWEYKAVANLAIELPTIGSVGPAARFAQALQDYQPLAQYYGSGNGDLERYARLRLEAFEAHAAEVSGAGNVPSVLPGTRFSLTEHYAVGAGRDRFIFTSIAHDARNNLSDKLKIGSEADSIEPGYRNEFVVVRADLPWRPMYDSARHARPTAPGPQPAIVVGPEGKEVHTDELSRIQVRFPWDPEGRNTCWLRVVTPVAGSGWGSQYIPRVGQEVLVGFLQNDIDRPIVIGCVYDGTHKPPRFSDAGSLPANAALSGFKSQEFRGAGYGELLFDDSTGQIKTKLSSEFGKTQLNQGWIGHARSEGKSDYRGQGFELRTDLAGAVRAAQGLLLTADARANAKGNTLDRQELIGALDTALAVAKQLAELATTHDAGGTDTASQAELTELIRDWEDARAGVPVIAGSAPAGVAWSSPKSINASAGTNLDFVAVQDANVSTGRRLFLRAAQGLSAFAHKAGMNLISAAGKLQLQAHSDGIEIGAANGFISTRSRTC
jgi:type VI secretion system secreted protein VgrG